MPKTVVLVIREKDRFAEALGKQGIEVVNLPLIRTEPMADPGLLIEKLSRLALYDGVFFTSPAAVEVFLEHGLDSASEFPGKFYVLGQRGKTAFDEAGIAAEYFDHASTSVELIGQIGVSSFAGKRLLFVRGNRSIRSIPAMLGSIADVEEIIVYNTLELVPPDDILLKTREQLAGGQINCLCFFSPSAVDCFVRYFGNEIQDRTHVAAIGDTTANAARDALLNVQFVSSKADAALFADELVRYITSNEQ